MKPYFCISSHMAGILESSSPFSSCSISFFNDLDWGGVPLSLAPTHTLQHASTYRYSSLVLDKDWLRYLMYFSVSSLTICCPAVSTENNHVFTHSIRGMGEYLNSDLLQQFLLCCAFFCECLLCPAWLNIAGHSSCERSSQLVDSQCQQEVLWLGSLRP